ncbi:MAG: signal peptidase II [Proteobacteria bacterium]|nr:signal peptidase II [Pseudomonadota bacterium]
MRIYVFVAILLVGIDQLIKHLVRLHLTASSYIEIIPNFIHLTYQENQGISFGFLSRLPDNIRVPLITGVSAVVIIGLTIYVVKNHRDLARFEKWGFTLILAGAVGNLIDRAFRQQVTDYMYFHIFDYSLFVNNFADDIISIGFVMIVWQSFRKKDGKTSGS